jgi:hypothetical protein
MFEPVTDERLAEMSHAELEAYRAQLESERVKLREHATKVAERFREVNDAINQAARLAPFAVPELVATPGVALARAIGAKLKKSRAHERGGKIMQEALGEAGDE